MTVTTTSLTRAAGISAAVAGLLFIAVQIKHPPMNVSGRGISLWRDQRQAAAITADGLVPARVEPAAVR
jgi:hypothetical protein